MKKKNIHRQNGRIEISSFKSILASISLEFLNAKLDFHGSLIHFFTVLDNMFLTAVTHAVNSLGSSVVIQELVLAIHFAL